MKLRRYRRALALTGALLAAVIRLGFMRLEGPMTPLRRAFWLQQCCRHILDSLGVRWRCEGTATRQGMVVSNHLSYLDVLVFSAVMPCTFVSKADVKQWPYFGWAARNAGTIFLDRSSRSSAGEVAAAMAARFRDCVPVLLFPEGTSSDGSQVLRFHATLFAPAVSEAVPVAAAAIRYQAGEEAQERELCWFDDATLLGHLWKVLGLQGVEAEVSFAEPSVFADRREAAARTHDAVVALRGALATLGFEARGGAVPGRMALAASYRAGS